MSSFNWRIIRDDWPNERDATNNLKLDEIMQAVIERNLVIAIVDNVDFYLYLHLYLHDLHCKYSVE